MIELTKMEKETLEQALYESLYRIYEQIDWQCETPDSTRNPDYFRDVYEWTRSACSKLGIKDVALEFTENKTDEENDRRTWEAEAQYHNL